MSGGFWGTTRKLRRWHWFSEHSNHIYALAGCGARPHSHDLLILYELGTIPPGGKDTCPRCAIIREIEQNQHTLTATISDGFGSTWPARCPDCGAPMQIVRPGDARCSAECDRGDPARGL